MIGPPNLVEGSCVGNWRLMN